MILDNSEASGSEALREYGPPKIQELPKGVLNQGLPDVEIEHNFIQVSPAVVAEVKEIDVSQDKKTAENQEAADVVSLVGEEKEINVQQDEGVVILKTGEGSEG